MKSTRSNPAAFNPEKFLATEKKKLAKATLSGTESVFPIAFTRSFSTRLIERLSREAPASFIFVMDDSDAMIRAMAAAVEKEIVAVGIKPDSGLITMLSLNLMAETQWRSEFMKHNADLIRKLKRKQRDQEKKA